MIGIADPKSTGVIREDDFLVLMQVLIEPEDEQEFEDDTLSDFKLTGMTDFAKMMETRNGFKFWKTDRTDEE